MSSLALLSHHCDVLLPMDLLKETGRKGQLDKWYPIIHQVGISSISSDKI